MMKFMSDELSREHRRLLREEADKARLAKLALENKRQDANRFRLWDLVRRVASNLEWLSRRSPVVTESKPVIARS